jgi:hypothetical protein
MNEETRLQNIAAQLSVELFNIQASLKTAHSTPYSTSPETKSQSEHLNSFPQVFLRVQDYWIPDSSSQLESKLEVNIVEETVEKLHGNEGREGILNWTKARLIFYVLRLKIRGSNTVPLLNHLLSY